MSKTWVAACKQTNEMASFAMPQPPKNAQINIIIMTQLMKKPIYPLLASFVVLILCFTCQIAEVKAQKKPRWTDYYQRNTEYPEIKYLVGFYSETGIATFSEEVNQRIAAVARKTLIESIQVKLQSVSSAEIENINAKTREYFKNTSISIAKADIVGLKYETYYDPKKEEAYALAYALRTDVIRYYHELLDTKLGITELKINNAIRFAESGDKEQALKSYFECIPIFHEIEEAQSILIALEKVSIGLEIPKTQSQKLAVKEGITELLSSDNLTLDEVGYFTAFGLKVQQETLTQPVRLAKLTYQDTEFESAFSARFKDVLTQNLSSVANYQVSRATDQTYTLEGSYWPEPESIKLIYNLYSPGEEGAVVASVESQLPKSYLTQKGISYLPRELEKIDMLDQIVLQTPSPRLEVKVGQEGQTPMRIKATYADEPIGNLPVIFKLGQDGPQVGNTQTNQAGIGQAVATNLPANKRIHIVIAEVDIPAWTGLDRSSAYYQRIRQNQNIPNARLIIQLKKPMVYVESQEKSLGRALDIPFIEPTVKQALADLGYEFTNELSEADLMLEIRSNSRVGNNAYGIYFSYADATVSILDMATGNEVYKSVVKNQKGGGANFEQASIKSLKTIADKVKDEVLRKLSE